ncbi:hypothetical protein BU26DRAFT_504116 [Trematosphaeria pertusa]|uniref:Uncharacterized protein n=1 Tax=Trematosphaeria pertusa TaxID=390896 RepID=A0A6A6IHL2_9PLEO|nr:uncharacterized protein BU26DRAFT_504116 [Trematosphaeria pertusa]KAF2249657.1 hypothetical protein BU26DRAFT_504116 [Trematosphaeria pertusa]
MQATLSLAPRTGGLAVRVGTCLPSSASRSQPAATDPQTNARPAIEGQCCISTLSVSVGCWGIVSLENPNPTPCDGRCSRNNKLSTTSQGRSRYPPPASRGLHTPLYLPALLTSFVRLCCPSNQEDPPRLELATQYQPMLLVPVVFANCRWNWRREAAVDFVSHRALRLVCVTFPTVTRKATISYTCIPHLTADSSTRKLRRLDPERDRGEPVILKTIWFPLPIETTRTDTSEAEACGHPMLWTSSGTAHVQSFGQESQSHAMRFIQHQRCCFGPISPSTAWTGRFPLLNRQYAKPCTHLHHYYARKYDYQK